jgi:DNA-binding response OmpR family regulator
VRCKWIAVIVQVAAISAVSTLRNAWVSLRTLAFTSINSLRISTTSPASSSRLNEVFCSSAASPGEDGLTVMRTLRASGPVGIILLTANNAGVDRIVGLEIGADDYITKPFDPRELLARIRSMIRRIAQPDAKPVLGREVRIGRCVINLDTCRLFERDGREVHLTAMEFDLLNAFCRHPNQALSRDRLLDLAHGREATPFDRSIDTRIARLRQKVEIDPAHPQAIRTVRGLGYRFNLGLDVPGA